MTLQKANTLQDIIKSDRPIEVAAAIKPLLYLMKSSKYKYWQEKKIIK